MRNITPLGCIGLIGVTAVAIVLEYLCIGFVMEQLWQWFAVPLGAPDITAAHAIGIVILGGYVIQKQSLAQRMSDSKDKSWGEIITSSFVTIIGSAVLVLFIGNIIHSLM